MIDDPRFASNATRVTHRDQCLRVIFDRLAEMETAPLMEALDDHGVPYSPVNTLESLWADGQVEAMGVLEHGTDPAYGNFQIMGLPFSITDHDRGLSRTAPRIGEHSCEVLRELGYDEKRIEHLIKNKVIIAS